MVDHENLQIKNKRKSIELIYGKDEKYSIDFINEGTSLSIEAKTKYDILTIIYSGKFSLEDIKKVKFFNDDYISIDECLAEIFEKLDKNEGKIEKSQIDVINIKVSLSKRYEIIFPLKKIEKNESQKYQELLNIILNLKNNQENEIKMLKNKINFLENLLKAKNNKDYKKGLELFNGSVIEMTCFGRNEIENYFDLTQGYAYFKKEDNASNKYPNFFSFVFKCKDDNDIPLVVDSFRQIKNNYGSSNNIFTRVKNNKLFVEIRFDATDLLELDSNILENLCFSSGQSLIIKTDAIPRDMFEEFNKEKILKFILDTDLEFSNSSPQLQIFAKAFQKITKNFPHYLQDIIRDIFINLLNGNYKYKPTKKLIEDEVETIYNSLKDVIYCFSIELLNIGQFKEYKKINFNEIEFNLLSIKYKAGFNYKIKVPKHNELIDDLINERVKKY